MLSTAYKYGEALALEELYTELQKIAGDTDWGQLKQLSQNLRPGDVVNFETLFPEIAREQGLREAMKSKALSGTISRVTGTPQSHTAIVGHVDPETGRLTLVHNYEQGKKITVHQVTPENFDEFTRSRKLHFYRPAGATPEHGMAAARRAFEAAGREAPYSKADLLLGGLRAGMESAHASSRIPGASRLGGLGTSLIDNASSIGRTNADPAAGFCSHLVSHAWSEPLGSEHAAQSLFGHAPTAGTASRLSVTPASIAEAAADGRLQHLGTYTPKNILGTLGEASRERLGSKLRALFRMR